MAESAPVAEEIRTSSKPKDSAFSLAVAQSDVPDMNARNLIESGAHLGHSARNWDPRMKRFIFGKKSGIHVVNVKETLRGVVRARHFLRQVASAGLNILMVGTKKQAADIVRTEAARCDMPFVASRWLGGTLTNHATIRRRLERLTQIEKLKEGGGFTRESKKQQARIDREHKKIAFNLEGLRELDSLPAVMLVVDVRHEHNAVAEARKLNIPVVGIVDTDSNPELVDIVIPANDDALRGIQIILHYLADGILEGVEMHEAGHGLKEKGGLVVSSYDELGPTGREKKRSRGGQKPRRDNRRSGGPRTDEAKAHVETAASEAVAQAESQTKPAPRAAVRVKPKAMEGGPAAGNRPGGAPGADHKPAGGAPAAGNKPAAGHVPAKAAASAPAAPADGKSGE